MVLTEDDMRRIRELGFAESYFASESDGWLELRNRSGRCVFNDGTMCLIYADRPEGCRSYPVVCEKGGAALDRDCPHREEFPIAGPDGARVAALAHKLKEERKIRKTR